MTPKQQSITNLRSLTGARPTPESTLPEIFPFGVMMPLDGTPRRYDDRAIVIIVATVLEQALEVALMTRFVELDHDAERAVFVNESAPLNSLAAKITMAFALGIIGRKSRSDLNIIRELRNTFAHSRLTVSFDTPEIAATCGFITLPERWPNLVGDTDHVRERFIQSAFQYVLDLTLFEKDRPFGGPEGQEKWSCLDE
jgi:DNA-binding MltR family transcriptional regulator